MKPDKIFKVSIGGAGGVGKTTLLIRYIEGHFKENTMLTVGVGFFSKNISKENKNITLSLWDLGGQDRFRIIQPSYVKGSSAGILFFDMANLTSLNQVEKWVNLFRQNAHPDLPILLCGTKYDLIEPILYEDIQNNALEQVEKFGLTTFFPTSSKTGLNVDELMDYLVGLLLKTKLIKNPTPVF